MTERNNYDQVRAELFSALDNMSTQETQSLLKEVVEAILLKAFPRPASSTAELQKYMEHFTEIRVVDILQRIGIPANIKGYTYLEAAITYYAESKKKNGGTGCAVTRELYPAVAKKYNTTANRVERAIRHAIQVAWERGDQKIQEEYFGNAADAIRTKPTNAEFIAKVVRLMEISV